MQREFLNTLIILLNKLLANTRPNKGYSYLIHGLLLHDYKDS